MATGTTSGASLNKTLGVLIKGKYATTKDLDRIAGALNWFVIKATSTSTTTDFGDLEVGDYVIQIRPAGSATTIEYLTVVTAGTLPESAVAADLYVVFRP